MTSMKYVAGQMTKLLQHYMSKNIVIDKSNSIILMANVKSNVFSISCGILEMRHPKTTKQIEVDKKLHIMNKKMCSVKTNLHYNPTSTIHNKAKQ